MGINVYYFIIALYVLMLHNITSAYQQQNWNTSDTLMTTNRHSVAYAQFFLSVTSTHFKWELMLYCLHCSTLNKVFLLLLMHDLWGVHCEHFVNHWSHHNGITLYRQMYYCLFDTISCYRSGCGFTDVLLALQTNLTKIYNATSHIYSENFNLNYVCVPKAMLWAHKVLALPTSQTWINFVWEWCISVREMC